MIPTPEELTRLPEFDGKRIVDHWDDGLSWTWPWKSGRSLSPLGETEKAMLALMLTDRRTLERYRATLKEISFKSQSAKIRDIALAALSKED